MALQKLAAYLDIPTAQTMAFGDDLNDITMLQAAGIGVAMGNAADDVKAAADYVTRDCEDDGISAACKHFALIS
jgi:hydroxymethylpyrimidine pyrophosphatase-like HAD family hydrolase